MLRSLTRLPARARIPIRRPFSSRLLPPKHWENNPRVKKAPFKFMTWPDMTKVDEALKKIPHLKEGQELNAIRQWLGQWGVEVPSPGIQLLESDDSDYPFEVRFA